MDNKWNKSNPRAKLYIKRRGTEPPGSSHLNQEKRVIIIALVVELNFFNSSMKFESGSGYYHFSSLPEVLKLRLTLISVTKNRISCKMWWSPVTFSMMDPNLRVRFCNNGLCLFFKPKK